MFVAFIDSFQLAHLMNDHRITRIDSTYDDNTISTVITNLIFLFHVAVHVLRFKH